MQQDFLSDIELYYSLEFDKLNSCCIITGDEAHHALNVMRHNIADIIYVTDGKGNIYKSEIFNNIKRIVSLKILETYSYSNPYENIIFCVPRLKNQDRFEFALEKCIELGITNFIIYESERTVAKGDKSEKWSKLGIAAMKQSLRSYLPEFSFCKNPDEILKKYSGSVICTFDQKADKVFSGSVINELKKIKESKIFLFGPEGGFSDREMKKFSSTQLFRLTGNRLRSETAIITAAILLADL